MEPEEKKPLKSRYAIRQLIFQLAYALDTPDADIETLLQNTLAPYELAPGLSDFIRGTVFDLEERFEELDNLIAAFLAKGWNIERITKVDRALLRLAAYELHYIPSIPPKVTINEAVNLAKIFGSAESPRFINGLLGRLVEQSPKAKWDPSQASEDDFMRLEAGGPDPEDSSEEVLEEGTAEFDEAFSAGAWMIRTNEDQK